MSNHRGLTLLEVLLATVLMTMIAATCVPIIQRSAAILREVESTDGMDVARLAQRVDLWLAEHESELAETRADQTIDEVIASNGEVLPAIAVHRLTTDDPEADHGWLVFTCGDASILRWIAITREETPAP